MFERISLEHGLSQSSIYSIIQDREGFMWFGTEEGLNKYDGSLFKIYKNIKEDHDSIADNFIKKLYEDTEGTLWIGSLHGYVMGYNKMSDNFLNIMIDFDPGTEKSELTSFADVSQDKILIGSYYNGLKLYDKKKKCLTKFFFENSNYDESNLKDISSILKDSCGLIWIGTWDNGIYVMDCKNQTIKNLNTISGGYNKLINSSIRCIYEDKNNDIWIGTNNGLNFFDRDKNQFVNYPLPDILSKSDSLIYSIIEDNSENFWVGTRNNGLFKINKNKKFDHYKFDKHDINSISNNTIYSLLLDRSNVLWIGTLGNGLNKLDCNLKKFYNLKFENNSKSELGSVISIFIDKNRNYWISSFNNGTKIFKKNENELIPNNEINLGQYSDESVTALVEDGKNNIWLSSLRKECFCKYSLENNELTEYSHPQKYGINSLLLINSDLYLAIREKGILKYDTQNGKFLEFEIDDPLFENIKSNVIYCMYFDSDSVLWLGSIREGLFRFDTRTQEIQNYKYRQNDVHSISDDCIICIAEDSYKNIWIGTKNGGLNKYDRKSNSFLRFDSKIGFPNNYLKGILQDSNNNLWISTNSGLSKFNLLNYEIKNYFFTDGLQSKEFNDRAYFKDEDGIMYFGGINGVTCFNPDEIKDNPHIPNIAITEFEIFNETVTGISDNPYLKKNIIYADEINLSYKESVFSFRFASLIFNNPQKNQYAYKMEGFDKDWTYCGTRKRVTYTNLDPGTYTFRVKGSNNDGIWNEEGTSVKINISPPYWKTWWFKSLGIIGAVAATGLTYKQRLDKIEKERKAQEEFSRKLIESQEHERKRIAHDLHETIAHEILISKQKAAMALKHKENKEGMEEALKEISEMASSTINDVRSIAYNLHPHQLERLGLKKTILSNINNADKSTNISFISDVDDIDNLISKESEINLFRVIQEIISNIIYHSKATKAVFKIKIIGRNIFCLISDNGTGFNVSDKLLPEAKKGIGLEGIAERIKFMGQYRIESEPGKGTIYKIKIPITENLK